MNFLRKTFREQAVTTKMLLQGVTLMQIQLFMRSTIIIVDLTQFFPIDFLNYSMPLQLLISIFHCHTIFRSWQSLVFTTNVGKILVLSIFGFGQMKRFKLRSHLSRLEVIGKSVSNRRHFEARCLWFYLRGTAN